MATRLLCSIHFIGQLPSPQWKACLYLYTPHFQDGLLVYLSPEHSCSWVHMQTGASVCLNHGLVAKPPSLISGEWGIMDTGQMKNAHHLLLCVFSMESLPAASFLHDPRVEMDLSYLNVKESRNAASRATRGQPTPHVPRIRMQMTPGRQRVPRPSLSGHHPLRVPQSSQ